MSAYVFIVQEIHYQFKTSAISKLLIQIFNHNLHKTLKTKVLLDLEVYQFKIFHSY